MPRLALFGKSRTVSDLGRKDTVFVWPGEMVRIAIDFTHDFPGNKTYVFHCHNLEHEDEDEYEKRQTLLDHDS